MCFCIAVCSFTVSDIEYTWDKFNLLPVARWRSTYVRGGVERRGGREGKSDLELARDHGDGDGLKVLIVLS